MKKLVIEELTGKVVNIIEIKKGASWAPPDGCIVLAQTGGGIGDTWDGVSFVPAVEIAPEPQRDLLAEIDDLKARIEKLEK